MFKSAMKSMEGSPGQMPTKEQTLESNTAPNLDGVTSTSSRKCVEDYNALVETIFRPIPSDPKADETALLPRLLNRVSSAMWSQGPSKDLVDEIQSLREQKVAASQLLDSIEQEAEEIEQHLQEKSRLAKVQRNKGMLVFPCVACSNCGINAEEITLQTNHASDRLELRPVLRHRLQECEQTLAERDAELRQLHHELRLLRHEQAAACHEEKDVLLDQSRNTKDSTLRQYVAKFVLEGSSQSQLQSIFYVWKQYTHQRIFRTKLLKGTGLALASSPVQSVALVFSGWKCLVQAHKDKKRLAQENRSKKVAQCYATRFLTQANDSTVLRAIVIQWWRCSKEAALQTRIMEAEALRQAALRESRVADIPVTKQNSPKLDDKACCVMM
jgi:hypothetical protein